MWVKGSARAYSVRQVARISDSAALDQSDTELQGHRHGSLARYVCTATALAGIIELCGGSNYDSLSIQPPFASHSTAVRPFDDLRYELSGLLH